MTAGALAHTGCPLNPVFMTGDVGGKFDVRRAVHALKALQTRIKGHKAPLGEAHHRDAFDKLIWPTFDTFIWPTRSSMFSFPSGEEVFSVAPAGAKSCGPVCRTAFRTERAAGPRSRVV